MWKRVKGKLNLKGLEPFLKIVYDSVIENYLDKGKLSNMIITIMERLTQTCMEG